LLRSCQVKKGFIIISSNCEELGNRSPSDIFIKGPGIPTKLFSVIFKSSRSHLHLHNHHTHSYVCVIISVSCNLLMGKCGSVLLEVVVLTLAWAQVTLPVSSSRSRAVELNSFMAPDSFPPPSTAGEESPGQGQGTQAQFPFDSRNYYKTQGNAENPSTPTCVEGLKVKLHVRKTGHTASSLLTVKLFPISVPI